MKSLRYAFLLSLVVLLIAGCTNLPSLSPSATQPATERGAAEPATAEPPVAATAPTATSGAVPVQAAPTVAASAAVTVTAPLIANGAGAATPGAAQATGAAPLVNVVWEWAALLKTSPATQSVIPDPSVYAVMFSENGELMIKADCNVARGTYTVANDQLTLVLGATTKEACQPGSLSQSMLDSLSKVASYTIDDGDLILRVKDNGDSMLFRNGGPVVPPAPPPVTASGTAPAPRTAPLEMTPTPTPAAAATAAPPPSPATQLQLVGTTWQWEKLVDAATGKNSLDVKNPANYTVTFTVDGKAVMKSDCNSVTGTYKVDGIKLTVEVGAITVAPCAAGSLTGAFLVDLTSAASFKIENGKLNVDLMADGGRMVFGAK